VITDLEGAVFRQLGGEAINVVRSLMGCNSDKYPDTLGKLCIINARGIGVGDKGDKGHGNRMDKKREA
jgi:hypothetical protein